MQFTEFSNPRDFMLLNRLNENKDQGASNSNNIRNSYQSPNVDSLYEDDDEKSAGARIVNRYNPKKNISENTWLPETSKAVSDYMDLTDYNTLNVISVMNEEEQNTLLVNLTNKLYSLIVGKIDHIDFGEIRNTRGDITRLSKYNDLKECISVLENIFDQYREDTRIVHVLRDALFNIEENKDLFTAGFAVKAPFVMNIYKTVTLALINATSFMIAVCIEFIKTPKNEGLSIVLNKTGISKAKDHLAYESLIDFNESCKKGEVQGALKPMVQNKAKGFVMTAALGFKALLVLGGVTIALIPMLRNLVYFFYATRTRVSEYFDLQAKLLEMNVEELEGNPDIKTEDDKKAVINRQLTIARTFHKIADSIAIEGKTAEAEATREIKKEKIEYKIDDIEPTGTQDTGGENGSLF